MKYWLMKCEPSAYSIDDFKKEKECFWEGVRNYQARNFMRDDMKIGDKVLFYQSNAKPPGVVGLAKVSREGYPDFTSWDPKNHYYDPKSSPEKPLWYMVDLLYVEQFPKVLSLASLRDIPELKEMVLLKKV